VSARQASLDRRTADAERHGDGRPPCLQPLATAQHLEPANERAVLRRIIREEPEQLPGRLPGVDVVHELRDLAGEAARAVNDQRLHEDQA
jgi:hypothetical protein